MQKRSHKLLASSLLESVEGFQARRFELAFLFGSFQPDCNPLTYLKGSLRAYKFRGHNYSNSQCLHRAATSAASSARRRWTMWQYYTLGKLTHYLADAFTYPHNEHYPDPLLCHHQYETDLRAYLQEYLANRDPAAQAVPPGCGRRHRRSSTDYYQQDAADHADGRPVHSGGHQPADGRLPARRRFCQPEKFSRPH